MAGGTSGWAHGSLIPEAPLLVVPASINVSELKVSEIRMLIPQQRPHQVLPELEGVQPKASDDGPSVSAANRVERSAVPEDQGRSCPESLDRSCPDRKVRHTAAYDWRRIHSATPQRNALTCRDGCAFLSGEGSSRNLSTLLGHVLGWFIGLGWFPALVG